MALARFACGRASAAAASGETMPERDDDLRCPGCGCLNVVVIQDYQPGDWFAGQAECLYCRSRFSFTYEEVGE
jgi:hypothetical protein